MAKLSTRRGLYVDGTFKIVPKPFVQVYIIHGFIQTADGKKQVPLAYILMTGQTAEDYKAVNCKADIHTVVTDCTHFFMKTF